MLTLCGAGSVHGQTGNGLGPYDDTFLEGGIGVSRPLTAQPDPAAARAPWSITGWLRSTRRQPGEVRVLGLGNATEAQRWRGIVLQEGELRLVASPETVLRSGAVLEDGRWYAIAATYDGDRARLYLDGRELAAASAATTAVESRIELAPVPTAVMPATGTPAAGVPATHFGGSLALAAVAPVALSADQVRGLSARAPDFGAVNFNVVGAGWAVQEHAWRGLLEPQDPWTLPHGTAPVGAPVATPPTQTAGWRDEGGGVASIGAWHLMPAPQVDADGSRLSQPLYPERGWFAAEVPGTVLTTLIARGVYPDPDHGLDNLAIPESLNRQDYWYRSLFTAPAAMAGRRLTLTFKGVNYAAEVWLNGVRLGSIRGAFTRGVFDVSGLVLAGRDNALAVRVAPPPHPGIPHEQSVVAGPGDNGGAMAIDGPTFIATEGWDWIPGIRDRNTGLWQGVEIRASGPLAIGDPHVITHLPLPRVDAADLTITVPVENREAAATAGSVSVRIGDVVARRALEFKPGLTEVTFDAAQFPQLHLRSPRLWWPNGYGAADLHTLRIDVQNGGAPSDSRSVRFGIRELTYELSLFDHDGRLRRVEVDPTLGWLRSERLVDVTHAAIKRTPQGWAASLTPAGETSPAVRPAGGTALAPYLVIRVNGVPIAARGGNWGMDDARKRISRERLEPYFRLHRDAHLNIIRNWLGQNTEDVFYDLADEYGLLVLNDFWISTQEYQLEPQDPALFLANARDVISRYRNHPSIAVWFGRNEGVPQPILNEGLAELVAALDGTRHYTGSSNSVNLQGSGPYNYRPPEQYFTELARGFSVEVGTPSLSTLEALRASIPAADQWPLNDTFAYHDWHFGGNGDVATFMAALAEQYGPGTGLEDFERKAQLMDFVSYRAIFEGFQAHLWTRNSGRLLWMTHPAWPSNSWQIYSSDYDTAAAYYAVKKACEPVHAQLNLPDFSLTVVNTTRAAQRRLVLRSRVLTPDGRLLGERLDRVDVPEDDIVTRPPPPYLAAALEREGLVLVKLTLSDAAGTVLSDNLYWQSRTPAEQRRLNSLAAQDLTLTARRTTAPADPGVVVTLKNAGAGAALNAKLTMLDAAGARVLPVYYDDNYVSLLPGETRRIEIRCPSAGARCARVALRGWNVVPREAAVE